MNEIVNKPAQHVDAAVDDKPFKGYTMEELKYTRAMMALRKEFAKEEIIKTFAQIFPKKNHDNLPIVGSKFALARTVASKVFSNLNLLDYAMVGMSIFGTARKAYNLFKKKKK